MRGVRGGAKGDREKERRRELWALNELASAETLDVLPDDDAAPGSRGDDHVLAGHEQSLNADGAAQQSEVMRRNLRILSPPANRHLRILT